jgi:hypothetical protein
MLFLFPASLLAQTTSTVSGTSSTVVFSKPSTADAYTSAHPGAKLARAASGKLTFLNPDRTLTMMSGGGVSYQQNGLWTPSKLQVAALNDGSGWQLSGVPINVSLTGSQGQAKDLSLNSGSVTMNFHLPQLSYNGDDTFTFQENGTTWLLSHSGVLHILSRRHSNCGSTALKRRKGKRFTSHVKIRQIVFRPLNIRCSLGAGTGNGVASPLKRHSADGSAADYRIRAQTAVPGDLRPLGWASRNNDAERLSRPRPPSWRVDAGRFSSRHNRHQRKGGCPH